MDFIEFKNRWLSKERLGEDDQLIVFDKSIVQEINFKSETALFLTEKGLPKTCAPWLEFESEHYEDSEQPVAFNDYFNFSNQIYSGYYIIGSQNNYGEWPLCIDIKNNDRLVLIDINQVLKNETGEIAALFDDKRPQNYDPVILINSSLEQFVFSAIAFRDFLDFVRKKKNVLPSDIEDIFAKLTLIDSDAMKENTFWRSAPNRCNFDFKN